MLTVFHYTDELGLSGMTNSEERWYPSSGVTLDPRSKPLELLQRTLTFASRCFYSSASEKRDWSSPKSTLYNDIHYGPGWYVTPLAPTTSTDELLNALWSGNKGFLPRTRYWLEIEVPEVCLKYPDTERSSVGFMPFISKISRSSNNLVGQNAHGAFLKRCGERIQKKGHVVSRVTKEWEPPLILIEPFITAVDGFELLSPDTQANLLGYVGLDSGFPGLLDPADITPAKLDSHQANAMAHLMIKWLDPEFKFDPPRRQMYSEDDSFSVQLRATRNVGTQKQAIEALILCQQSPVRRDVVQAFFEGIEDGLGFVVTTSTFAENAWERSGGRPRVLVLATQQRRLTMHTVILTDAIISFRRCDYWAVVGDADSRRYAKIQSTAEMREMLGLIA